MAQKNLFEKAALAIALLQQAQWNKEGRQMQSELVGIGEFCSSCEEAKIIADTIKSALSAFSTSYSWVEPEKSQSASEVRRGENENIRMSAYGGFDEQTMTRFKTDNSLQNPSSPITAVSSKAEKNLRQALESVRDAETKEWKRGKQGDFYKVMPVSHGVKKNVLYSAREIAEWNGWLKSLPVYRDTPNSPEIPRIWGDINPASSYNPVIMVRKKDAKEILVDMMGLDAQKLGISEISR